MFGSRIFRTSTLWTLLALSSSVWAANRVEVESVSVGAGGNTTVGVFLENDVTLRGIRIPLIVREITPGAFMIAWTPQYNPNARLAGYLTGVILIGEFPNEDGTCKNGSSGGFATLGSADLISPDGVSFSRNAVGGGDLPAGTDYPIGTGEPSVLIDLTVTTVGGTFEIDTSCVNPDGHLIFNLPGGSSRVPSFTKGTITIVDCICPRQMDYDDDGFPTAVDLQGIADVLFRGMIDPQDSGCPATRSDVDCDGFATSLDLVRIVDYLFAGGAAPCDPCSCSPYPTSCP